MSRSLNKFPTLNKSPGSYGNFPFVQRQNRPPTPKAQELDNYKTAIQNDIEISSYINMYSLCAEGPLPGFYIRNKQETAI